MSQITETTPTDTRERLLNAALQIFMKEGYARATTRRIASHADVSEVTLFRHFGNKLNLIINAIDEFSGNHSIKILMQEQNTGELVYDLKQISKHILGLIKNNRDMLRMMVEVHQIPELHTQLRQNARERRALFNTYFEAQIKQGMIRDSIEPETLTLAFLGMIMSYGMSGKVHDDTSEEIERKIDGMIDIFLNGTLA